MLISSASDVIDFKVLDPDVNFSDHIPLARNISIYIADSVKHEGLSRRATKTLPVHSHLRWDHTDTAPFHNHTGKLLEPIFTEINDIKIDDVQPHASYHY